VGLVALLAMAGPATAAPAGGERLAQAAANLEVGALVIFELSDGSLVKGTLLDKVPDGYLVREADGESSRVLPYEQVVAYHLVEGGAEEPRSGDGDEAASQQGDSPKRYFQFIDPSSTRKYPIHRGGTEFRLLPRDLVDELAGEFAIYDQAGEAYSLGDFWRAVGRGSWYDATAAQAERLLSTSRVLGYAGLGLGAATVVLVLLRLATNISGMAVVGWPLGVAGASVGITALVLRGAGKGLMADLMDPREVYDAAYGFSERQGARGPAAFPGLHAGLGR